MIFLAAKPVLNKLSLSFELTKPGRKVNPAATIPVFFKKLSLDMFLTLTFSMYIISSLFLFLNSYCQPNSYRVSIPKFP